MQRPFAFRIAAAGLLLFAPLLFAALAITLGKEAGWDFQNYHWYTPFALLNHRIGFDLAVAHHATYYNPLIDLPLYWIAQRGPAWLGGAFLGAWYGCAVSLLGAIAYYTFPIANCYWRLVNASTLALLGAAGGGAFPAIGNTSNDVPVAIGIFAALLIIVRNFSKLEHRSADRKILLWMVIAGICAGSSIGLKLTTAIYAPGLVLAVLMTAPTLKQRSAYTTSLCIGVAIGIALFGGYWMARMWEFGRNPVFPYFNQIFHSPLLVEGSYRDPSYFPKSTLTAWLFPFFFTADSHLVAEWDFRDAHILLAYIIVPVTLILLLFKRTRGDGAVTSKLGLFLCVFSSVSYVAWLALFCVYRYVIPLEMLCPLIIAASVMLWPLSRFAQFSLLLVLFVDAQAVVTMTLERQSWGKAYVAVAAPKLPDPRHSMVLMSGIAPMAFVIPSFPHDVPFIRIDGWLVRKDDHSSGFALKLHERVAAHSGPLYLLFALNDRDNAIQAAREYQLMLSNKRCQLVSSNIAQPLGLCKVERMRIQ